MGPVTPDAARAAGLPVRDGALIVEVAAGGPADLPGLRTGDVIVAIDEQGVRRPRDLTRRVAFTRPDTDVELEVVRPGVGPLRTKATLVRAEPAGG
jgi:serine protease Do